MQANGRGVARYTFGDFVADVAAGELLRAGRRLRLQEKPFQLLLALVERPGEVLTREELSERLWPGGIHVDYEQGLGNAVQKLRQALNDSADSPRYVETLPRRGYR
ncbi:MAG: winged helix-turn-helix domain-containing protein, partial [Candidatus Acidiferrales bacterium]